MGLLGGLLLERPRHYDPTLRDSSYRDFRTLVEIEAAQAHLARLIDLDRLFKAFDIPFSSASGIGFLSYKNLLLTLWARAWLQMSPAVAAPSKLAIPIDRFRSFFDALWTESEGDGRRLINDERKQAFLQWLESVSNIPVKTLSDRLGRVFEGLFDEIENELGVVASGNLDPRHVHLFLLKL